jgi:microsomal dipeptidase-like Zn-dependent dipeptidase
MRKTRTTRALVALALAGLSLASAGVVHAGEPCRASRGEARKLWEKYAQLAVKYGCAKDEASLGGQLAEVRKRCDGDPQIAALMAAGLARDHAKRLVGLSIPRRLEFAAQKGDLKSTLGRTWIAPEPYELDEVSVELEKVDGGSKASVEVCAHTADGRSRALWDTTLDPGRSNQGRTFKHKMSGVKGAILSVTVDAKSVARKIEYTLRLVRPGQGDIQSPRTRSGGTVDGFADTHLHQLSYLGFAGAWVWPSVTAVMRACTGKNHGRIWLNGKEGAPFRTSHTDRTDPKDWWHHMDTTHQQVHMTLLEKAHKGGLNLIVLPVVNSEAAINTLLNPATKDPDIPHDDMDSVKLQLRTAHALAAKYPWYRIARDPWEARRIIKDGGLAVILSVEVSDIMPPSHGEWQHQLDELYDLGVRTFTMAHESDSHFAGAAAHHGLTMGLNQFGKNLKMGRIFKLKDGRNQRGLTAEGRMLVRELTRRRILIELDHLSRNSRRDVYDMVATQGAKGNIGWYPLFFSHSRFDELMPSKDELEGWIGKNDLGYKEAKAHGGKGGDGTGEYMATDEDALWVRATGGVFGIRTGPNAQRAYRRSGVANRCHTSSRSLAQIYGYGLHRFGLAMTLGTDLSGFVAQTAPRFGADACSKLGNQRSDRRESDKPVGSDFDSKGLAHVGLEPDLIKDLGNLGMNTRNLDRSAETFLRMWERAYDDDRRELDGAGYRRLMDTAAPDDVRSGDVLTKGRALHVGAGNQPFCPDGFHYEVRNPLNRDRCVKTQVAEAPTECKLLITDKKKNWTGPHAVKGADECRSVKDKKPKGVKCPRGYDLNIEPGKDRCVKREEVHETPSCPAGKKLDSRSGRDSCE